MSDQTDKNALAGEDELAGLLPLDSTPGPARRISSQRAMQMIETALGSLDVPVAPEAGAEHDAEAGPAMAEDAAKAHQQHVSEQMARLSESIARLPDTAPMRDVRPPRRLGQIGILVAAALVIAGVAAAGVYTLRERAEAPHEAAVPASSRLAQPAHAGRPERQHDAGAADAGVPDTGVPDAAAPDAANSDQQLNTAPPAAQPDIRPTLRRAERTPIRPVPAGAQPTPVAPPEDLMRQANDQRKARRWREADRLYQQLIAAHPGTHTAYVATVASASIRLQHLGNPRGALALYQTALASRPAGALAEEARYGIAEAYRKLGHRQAEIDALRAFIANHQSSPLVDQASERLRELSDPAGDGTRKDRR